MVYGIQYWGKQRKQSGKTENTGNFSQICFNYFLHLTHHIKLKTHSFLAFPMAYTPLIAKSSGKVGGEVRKRHRASRDTTSLSSNCKIVRILKRYIIKLQCEPQRYNTKTDDCRVLCPSCI